MSNEHENSVLRKTLEKIRREVEFYVFDEPEVDSHEKFVDSFTENPPDYTTLRDTLFALDRILREYDQEISHLEEENGRS